MQSRKSRHSIFQAASSVTMSRAATAPKYSSSRDTQPCCLHHTAGRMKSASPVISRMVPMVCALIWLTVKLIITSLRGWSLSSALRCPPGLFIISTFSTPLLVNLLKRRSPTASLVLSVKLA
ncbi:MAG: hypothetical protein J3K34DRAFT_433639 [Monoraphidium minutum]|nr:MAG: hypothetical protein J3K34DRAFT_433639 [Monoraphidium minutum]